jgi:site-specific recombinase XerC
MSADTAVIGPIQGKGADIVPSPSLDQAREFARHSKAENTLRGYRADWRDFCAWCESHGVSPVARGPPETVAAYIAECAGRLKVGSIQRRLNAIAEAHKATGLDSPTTAGMVRNTLKGIRRTLGTARKPKAPTLTDDIRAMVDAPDAGLIGARDRALILLGFAGAFRRSELVGLDIADCAFGKDGLTVTLRRSKTDQDGAGRKIGIPYGSNPETCPVRTIQAWIETGRTIGRRTIPRDQSAWAGTGGPTKRNRRGARGEETRGAGRTGRGQVCGPFAAGWTRHQRGDCGRVRALDHESDRRIGASRWCGATSGTAVCFGRIARGKLGLSSGASYSRLWRDSFPRQRANA